MLRPVILRLVAVWLLNDPVIGLKLADVLYCTSYAVAFVTADQLTSIDVDVTVVANPVGVASVVIALSILDAALSPALFDA
jgi:hypothetical protein